MALELDLEQSEPDKKKVNMFVILCNVFGMEKVTIRFCASYASK